MQTGSPRYVLSPEGRIRFVLGITSFIVAAIVIAFVSLNQLHEQVERRISATTENLSRSVTQTFNGMIDTIDVALSGAAREIQHQISLGEIDEAAVSKMLAEQRDDIPFVSFIRATNVQGDIVFGPDTPYPYDNNSDRAYFSLQRDNRDIGLFVDKPLFGRISQKWLWTFSRRISRPDGSFAGVVFALVDLDQVNKVLEKIEIDVGGSISLRDKDRGLIARYPADSAAYFPIGEDRSSAPFVDALQRDPDRGTYQSGSTSIDGIDRMYSYQRSGKYGFIVNVGMDLDKAYAEWQRQAWMVGSVVLIFSLAIVAFAINIDRSRQRQARVTASLQDAQRIAALGSYSIELRGYQ